MNSLFDNPMLERLATLEVGRSFVICPDVSNLLMHDGPVLQTMAVTGNFRVLILQSTKTVHIGQDSLNLPRFVWMLVDKQGYLQHVAEEVYLSLLSCTSAAYEMARALSAPPALVATAPRRLRKAVKREIRYPDSPKTVRRLRMRHKP